MDAKRFAVVGASADERKVGYQILSNLHNNPDITVYPINLKGGTILDLPVFGHLYETPEPAEVVIISVPALAVEAVIDECIRISAKAVILISSGFAEIGESGAIIQKRIVDKLHASGILLLGPNTMGYIAPGQNIYASFGPSQVAGGPITVISQSGAMLSALFQEYVSANTGISFAMSLGNRTGINENDSLSYALSDPGTKIIVMYLESLADPKITLELAKRISTTKPIFLLKGGVTEAGRSAAVSHTAALATSQVLLDELCHQGGIVQVNNFEELVRASIACAKTNYLPENIMVVTNAGGPAVVLTDEISQAGIPLVDLAVPTKQALLSRLHGIKISNPLDLLGDASAGRYQDALTILTQDLTIDAIIVVVTEQAVTDMGELTRVLSRPRGKHLLFACLAGGDQLEPYREKLRLSGVVVTKYPNEIADTISDLYEAKKRLNKTEEQELSVKSNINQFPETFADLTNLLKKYEIDSPKEILLSKEEELDKLKDLGWPLIGKTTNLKLLHKAKIGAVIKDITNIEEAKSAMTKLSEWGETVVFQQKITEGIEVLLGVHNDPFWGWYMAVGMGGSLSDTYDDRAYTFLPATKPELTKALDRTKLAKVLSANQKNLLINTMYKLQDCALSTSSLTELEINPLFVSETISIAADLKRS